MEKTAPGQNKFSKRAVPLPNEVLRLPLIRTFSQDDLEQLGFDWMPEEMEDKWFGMLRSHEIRLYRSWTGYEIFRVPLIRSAGCEARSEELLINNHPEFHRTASYRNGNQELLALVNRLVDQWIRCETHGP